MILILELFLALALLATTVTDLWFREVPDWISYSLVTFSLGGRALISIILLDPTPILEGLAGFGACFAFGFILYYLGQWGGGDSKLIMGIGTCIGIPLSYSAFADRLPLYVLYTLIAASVYGACWFIGLAILNKKDFMTEYHRRAQATPFKIGRTIVGILLACSFALWFVPAPIELKVVALTITLAGGFLLYVGTAMKSIESSLLLVLTDPSDLTEGDWIAQDVVVGGTYICGPRDLGISADAIQKLKAYKEQGIVKNVLVKEGIPFVPAFLIGYVLLLILPNILAAVL